MNQERANIQLPPSDEVLLAFDRGELPEEQIESLTRWLEQNPDAEPRLQRLSEERKDSALLALRQPSSLQEELQRLQDLTRRVVEHAQQPMMPPAARITDRQDLSGTWIREYHLERSLGQGGMGSVYLAWHRRLQRPAALKVLSSQLALDPSFRSRFEREMAIIGQLDHPNLVRAYDAGEEGDQLFLAMELLDGMDLTALVETRGRPLDPADACELIRQAALGLHHAHLRGITHRDIKPGNLFLTRTGIIKVIDLGLARAVEGRLAGRLSSFRLVLGTPQYMAPEQWEKKPVGPATDLYALGGALFFLLTGCPPFFAPQDDTWATLLESQRKQATPSLREHCPNAAHELAALLARMLARESSQRPSSAAEVAEILTPLAKGHRIEELFLPPPERPHPPALRPSEPEKTRIWPWFLLAAFAVLGVVAVYYWLR